MRELPPSTRKKLVLAIAIIWVGSLGFVAIREELILRTGTQVVFRTEPIDPFDPFRGDFVILSYRFSSFWNLNRKSGDDPSNRWSDTFAPASKGFVPGSPVYAILRREGDYHVADRLSGTPPAEGELFLKGWTNTPADSFSYGIEKFFVPQGKGRILELSRNRGRLDAVVSIDSRGRGVLKELRIDGRPIDFANLQTDQGAPRPEPPPPISGENSFDSMTFETRPSAGGILTEEASATVNPDSLTAETGPQE